MERACFHDADGCTFPCCISDTFCLLPSCTAVKVDGVVNEAYKAIYDLFNMLYKILVWCTLVCNVSEYTPPLHATL
jgi:hypothetical protein